MKDEYVVINKTALEKQIAELEVLSKVESLVVTLTVRNEIESLKDVLSKSIPLIPIINNAFTAGQNKGAYHMKRQLRTGNLTFASPAKYISLLNLDI